VNRKSWFLVVVIVTMAAVWIHREWRQSRFIAALKISHLELSMGLAEADQQTPKVAVATKRQNVKIPSRKDPRWSLDGRDQVETDQPTGGVKLDCRQFGPKKGPKSTSGR